MRAMLRTSPLCCVIFSASRGSRGGWEKTENSTRERISISTRCCDVISKYSIAQTGTPPNMRILIDGQTLATPEIRRGIGVYFRNTIENVLANDLSNDYHIVANDVRELECFSQWGRDRINFRVIEPSNLSASEAERTEQYSDFINRIIENDNIDLYWTPNPLMTNVLLAARASRRATFAATVFDLIPLV